MISWLTKPGQSELPYALLLTPLYLSRAEMILSCSPHICSLQHSVMKSNCPYLHARFSACGGTNLQTPRSMWNRELMRMSFKLETFTLEKSSSTIWIYLTCNKVCCKCIMQSKREGKNESKGNSQLSPRDPPEFSFTAQGQARPCGHTKRFCRRI